MDGVETGTTVNEERLLGQGTGLDSWARRLNSQWQRLDKGLGFFYRSTTGFWVIFKSALFCACSVTGQPRGCGRAGLSSVSANWLLSYANINSSLSTFSPATSFRFLAIYLLCSLRREGSAGFQAGASQLSVGWLWMRARRGWCWEKEEGGVGRK